MSTNKTDFNLKKVFGSTNLEARQFSVESKGSGNIFMENEGRYLKCRN